MSETLAKKEEYQKEFQFIDLGNSESLNAEKIWITSDTHFGHRRILNLEHRNRHFLDVEEMDSGMISICNETVGKNDIIFHLGDFAFAKKERILEITSQLNGKIYLVLGNHEKRTPDRNWKELGFFQAFDVPVIIDEMFILTHEPLSQIPDGMINIHGHVHGSEDFVTMDTNRCCVCVERNNCVPVDYSFLKNMYYLEKIRNNPSILTEQYSSSESNLENV